jgi:hypothetical protein
MTHENRIQQLERRCRRLSAAVTALVALMGVVLLTGAIQGKSDGPLRTQKLEVVDSEGTVRIVLGEGDDHGYGVKLNDRDGKVRVALFESPLAAGVNIVKGFKCRLLVGEDGSFFSLADAQRAGGSHAALSVSQEEARMQLQHKDRKVVFSSPDAKQ